MSANTYINLLAQAEKLRRHNRQGSWKTKDKQAHIAKTELQNFINSHRKFVQDPGSSKPMTFHGLRHTCAAEWYKTLIVQGKTEHQARLQVSQWLGHERDDVTRVYLAGIANREDGGGGV